MAGILNVRTSAGDMKGCGKSGETCRFSHHNLHDIRYDDALRSVMATNNEDLRKRILPKLKASKNLFGQ